MVSAHTRYMLTYEIRCDFSGDVYEIFSVDASSISEAFELLGSVEGCIGTTLLGSIDRTPQTALAFG